MRLTTLFLPAVLLVCTSQIYGWQINPNPNPATNTRHVYTDATNIEDPFTNNGTINVTSDGTLTNSSDGILINNGTLYNFGTLTNSDGPSNDSSLTNNGTLYNYLGGTIDNNNVMKNNLSGTLDNYGTLNNNPGRTASTLANLGTLNNYSMLINYSGGWLANGFGGQLWNSGEFTNNGTIDTTTGVFVNAGTLNGSGHIKGKWIDHGKFKPGNAAGAMTIDGDYFKVEGSKEIELGGLLDGGDDKSLTEFDWIDVTGNVELAGLLNVSLIDGFELHRGNTFEFLRVGGTLTGQYDGLDEGDLVGNFGGEDLFITYTAGDGNDVSLYTNPVPEPTTLLLALLALVVAPLRVRCE